MELTWRLTNKISLYKAGKFVIYERWSHTKICGFTVCKGFFFSPALAEVRSPWTLSPHIFSRSGFSLSRVSKNMFGATI